MSEQPLGQDAPPAAERPSGVRRRHRLGWLKPLGTAVAIVTSIVAIVTSIVSLRLVHQDRQNDRDEALTTVEQQYQMADDSALPVVAREVENLQGRYPNENRLEILRGLLHTRSWELEKAERLFRQVLTEQPDNVQALFGLGSLLTLTGRPEEAVANLEQAWRLCNDDDLIVFREGREILLLHLAQAHAASGEPAQARRVLADLEALGLPANPHAHRLKGHAYRMESDFSAASREYHAALVLAPEDGDLLTAYVTSLADGGELEAQIARLEERLEDQPQQLHNPVVGGVLVVAYRYLGREDDERALRRRLDGV